MTSEESPARMDSRQRRRLQNCLAQRKHRKKMRAKREAQKILQNPNIINPTEPSNTEYRSTNSRFDFAQARVDSQDSSSDSSSTSEPIYSDTEVDTEVLGMQPVELLGLNCHYLNFSSSGLETADESPAHGGSTIRHDAQNLSDFGSEPFCLDSLYEDSTEEIGYSTQVDSGIHPLTVHRTQPRVRTALQISAEHGHEGLVGILLKFGADPNLSDSKGNVALHYAARNGHTGVAEALLKAGANATLINNYGYTAMHLACEKGFEQIVLLLLKSGLNLNN